MRILSLRLFPHKCSGEIRPLQSVSSAQQRLFAWWLPHRLQYNRATKVCPLDVYYISHHLLLNNKLTFCSEAASSGEDGPCGSGKPMVENTRNGENTNAFCPCLAPYLLFTHGMDGMLSSKSPWDALCMQKVSTVVARRSWRLSAIPANARKSMPDAVLLGIKLANLNLNKLYLCRLMRSDGIHPQVPRELASAIVRPPPLSLKAGSWGLEKADGTPVFKKSKQESVENCRPVNLTSVPGNVMEHIILETISKHVKDKKLTGSSQHEFTKTIACSGNF